ncbi:signal transduction histidine kinase [Pedobacter africanus]|uniref:Signal transduction histidine kinase n=1 Tax=Pedobacter africanus TaxID=151894 RepID=A0ACC6KQD2_9SPHI|nr:histidine kinase dimerization/phospho-acceptor domain-containing protein [Pedobacter africanus]MDR6781459.1 signal transduction histidine kinase [Pedobacter africanus]
MKTLAMKNKNYIVLLYLVIGSIWVILSDQVISVWIDGMPAHNRAVMHSLKAFLFIGISALLLQYLINLYHRGQKKNMDFLKKSLEESRKQQALINEQNTMLKEIAWINSHEIRKPLASILGLAELIRETDDQLEKSKYYPMVDSCIVELDEIVCRSAARLDELIAN